MRFGALFAVTLFATAASAQSRSVTTSSFSTGNHWSIYSGETITPGRDAVAFDVGWPGLIFGYLHGINDRTDVRLNVELLYGFEGTDASHFGFGLGAPLRLVLQRNDKLTLGVHVDPGVRVYTINSTGIFVMRAPIGGTAAIHVTPELDVTVAADLPIAIQFNSPTELLIGPAFGFALEYKVDRSLNVGLNTRFGPLFYTGAGGGSSFSFQTLLGVGYRL